MKFILWCIWEPVACVCSECCVEGDDRMLRALEPRLRLHDRRAASLEVLRAALCLLCKGASVVSHSVAIARVMGGATV